ncbi:hypothetical protein AD998_21215 [bacterium 336/3]|nr:hypothetical protein AD998_21215 [bacterium 336/3]
MMILFLNIIYLIILLIIFIEDLQKRTISIIFIVILALISFTESIILNGWYFWEDLLLNCFLIVLISVFITIYFYIKNKLQGIKNAIGLGDILFVTILTLKFSFFNFILFIPFSLIFSLILHLLCSFAKKYNKKLIPLAGFQAFLLFILILGNLLHLWGDLCRDENITLKTLYGL